METLTITGVKSGELGTGVWKLLTQGSRSYKLRTTGRHDLENDEPQKRQKETKDLGGKRGEWRHSP